MSAEADTSQTGPLDNEKLIAILRQEERDASNWQDAELNGVRTRALDYYDRKPLGDEEEGQSKVVTSEFADTVESIMPGMMDVFTSGDSLVEFTPLTQADEQAAREASLYVPHVLMRENDGFRILYWFLKDGLMYRLSSLTLDEEEKERSRTDPVEGWTAEQLAAAEELAREQGASEVSIEVNPDPAPPVTDVDPSTGQPIVPAETYSGTITVKRTKKRVVVDNVAPEDILFTPSIRDIDGASYAGYRKQVTASDLRKMGMEQEEIDQLSSDRPRSSEEDQRQDGQVSSTRGRKDSERKLWLVVAYVRADGDGVSETLRVIYAHAGGAATSIIETSPWDGPEVPIVLGTPIMMSHTVVGRSLFDQVEDLQDVGTALTRGMLDNLYMTNRPRPAINGRVNINSVLDWVAGMPIQVQGSENPSASIAWLQVPSIIGPALNGLEYQATVRENRTGVTRYNQGLDADSLNKTLGGIDRIMTASQQRQKLIARVFAETAIQRLIYRAIKRCAKGPIGATVAQPVNFLELIEASLNGPARPLDVVTEAVIDAYGEQSLGGPQLIAASGTNFRVKDVPDSGTTATLRYFKKLITPTPSAGNAILTAYPTLYLHGCLYEAAVYIGDPDAAKLYYSLYAGGVQSLNERRNRELWAASNVRLRIRGRTP